MPTLSFSCSCHLVPLPHALCSLDDVCMQSVSPQIVRLSDFQRAVLRSFAGLLSLFHELGLRFLREDRKNF